MPNDPQHTSSDRIKASSPASLPLRDQAVTALAVAGLLLVARYASPIVVPFLLALFITVVAIGPIGWMKKRGFSPTVSVVAITLLVIACNILVVLMLGSALDQFTNALPGYQSRLTEITQDWCAWGQTN